MLLLICRLVAEANVVSPLAYNKVLAVQEVLPVPPCDTSKVSIAVAIPEELIYTGIDAEPIALFLVEVATNQPVAFGK